MDNMVIPDLSILREWLDRLKLSYFECDACEALHLPHMQNIEGVFDAKVDIMDETLVFSSLSEVKPTAIIPLVANLSQINASSLLVKTFMDIQDVSLPKLVVCYSFPITAGMTFEQFSLVIQQAEEQIVSVIFEIFSNNMLYTTEEIEQEDEEDMLQSTPAPTPVLH